MNNQARSRKSRRKTDLIGTSIGPFTILSEVVGYTATSSKRVKAVCVKGHEVVREPSRFKLNSVCRECEAFDNSVGLIGTRFNRLIVTGDAEPYISVDYKNDRLKPLRQVKCICDCGKIISARVAELKCGHTKSCGCMVADWNKKKFRKPKGEAGFNGLIYRYRRQAKLRGYTFDLTEEQFRLMTKQNCHYCGTTPQTEANKKSTRRSDEAIAHETYEYNGIDRYMNNLGYRFDNCVPCCVGCNRKKGRLDGPIFEMSLKVASLNPEDRDRIWSTIGTEIRSLISNIFKSESKLKVS